MYNATEAEKEQKAGNIKMNFDLNNLVRENIKKLVPYSSARDEFKGEANVFLDANENSLGSPLTKWYNRYPDPLQIKVKEKLSTIKGVPVNNTFLGNGSDECIDVLIRAFCEPGIDNILICPPTYGMYQVSADINNAAVKKVRLTPDFQLDLPGIEQAIDGDTKMIFICSPNNPTGNLMHVLDIEFLLQHFTGIVVIDEAYIDFAETNSWLTKLDKYHNLVILQTLSKAWGLAALRIGLAFASTGIIDILNRIKPPYNISGITQELALEGLYNEERKNAAVAVIVDEKKKLVQLFSEFDFIEKTFPSDANFLLIKTNDAFKLYNYLVSQNIVVRNRSNQPLCENCLRITVGTPEENNILEQALKKYEA